MQSAVGLNPSIKQNVRIGCTANPRRQIFTGPAGVAALGKANFKRGQSFISASLDTWDCGCDTACLRVAHSTYLIVALFTQRLTHFSVAIDSFVVSTFGSLFSHRATSINILFVFIPSSFKQWHKCHCSKRPR